VLTCVGTFLAGAAHALGWRVGAALACTSSGHPVRALYDAEGEYVGIVAITPRRLVPAGEWGAADLQRLALVQRRFARNARRVDSPRAAKAFARWLRIRRAVRAGASP
jgi:hypothetical protein